jgi:glucose-6-phosphate isomerase
MPGDGYVVTAVRDDLGRIDALTWRDLSLGITLDLGASGIGPARLVTASREWDAAFSSMAALEAGAIANPAEGRRVGHYWLRAPELAPAELRGAIEAQVEAVLATAESIHVSREFTRVLVIGIGGSALGSQFLADALGGNHDPLPLSFLDNTDPDGAWRTLAPLDLARTLVVCVSKSGGTLETRNGLRVTQAAFARAGVEFGPRAVAVSQEGSVLWQEAAAWRARLPMFDFVGGRTSVTSAVGLFPQALQGHDVRALLAGAAAMDARTRVPDLRSNPAARLAFAWHELGEGRGRRAMVVLPYRDRLQLFPRYLQQLVMESIGKAVDLSGNEVHQGLAVYGNKGSTDQHAYVQQLREGPDDHFVTFVSVLDDGHESGGEVEPGLDSADFLQGFLHGTRRALTDAGHPSITLTLDALDIDRLGALVALYERAVGLYAARIGVNAYDQPGVEAGKRAAGSFLAGKRALLAALDDEERTAAELCARAGTDDFAAAHALLCRLAWNARGVHWEPGESPSLDRFCKVKPRRSSR